jgi:hypothetical protein
MDQVCRDPNLSLSDSVAVLFEVLLGWGHPCISLEGSAYLFTIYFDCALRQKYKSSLRMVGLAWLRPKALLFDWRAGYFELKNIFY